MSSMRSLTVALWFVVAVHVVTLARGACDLAAAQAAEAQCRKDCCASDTCNCAVGSTFTASGSIGFGRNITYATVCQYDRCVLAALKGSGCQFSPEYSKLYLTTLERKSACDSDIARLGCTTTTFAVLHSCLVVRFSCGDISACSPRCYSESVKCLVDAACIPSGVDTPLHLCRQSLYDDALKCDACNLPSIFDDNSSVPPTCQSHFLRCDAAVELLPGDFTMAGRAIKTPAPVVEGRASNTIYVIGGVLGGTLIAMGLVAVLLLFLRRRREEAAAAAASGPPAIEDARGSVEPVTERRHGGDKHRRRKGSGAGLGRKAWSSVHDGSVYVASDGSAADGSGRSDDYRPIDIVAPITDASAQQEGVQPNGRSRRTRDIGAPGEPGAAPSAEAKPLVPPMLTVANISDDSETSSSGPLGCLQSSSQPRKPVPRSGAHSSGSNAPVRNQQHVRTSSQTSAMNASLNELDLNFSLASEASTMPATSMAVKRSLVSQSSKQARRQRASIDEEGRRRRESTVCGRGDGDGSRGSGSGGDSTSSCDEGSHVPEAPVLRSLTATPTTMLPKDVIRHIKLNAYRRGRRLGKGADGTVSEVTFPNGFSVAVKEVPMIGRTTSEIRDVAMAFKPFLKLDHPNVCKLYTITFDAETSCLQLWMELLSGKSLDRVAQKRAHAAATSVDFGICGGSCGAVGEAHQPPASHSGVMPESVVAEYAAQILDGLLYLHENGIVHRDIKGANVALDAERRLVKILDFGSARVIAGEGPPPELVLPPGAVDDEGGLLQQASSAAGVMSMSSSGPILSPTASASTATALAAGGTVLSPSTPQMSLPVHVTSGTPHANAANRPAAFNDEAAGTPLWMAPELIKSRTMPPTFANDVWSFGVTCAELMNKGLPPWPPSSFANPWSAMYHIASTGARPTVPEGASQELEAFLNLCWTVDPKERATVSALREHPWITQNAPHVPRRRGKAQGPPAVAPPSGAISRGGSGTFGTNAPTAATTPTSVGTRSGGARLQQSPAVVALRTPMPQPNFEPMHVEEM